MLENGRFQALGDVESTCLFLGNVVGLIISRHFPGPNLGFGFLDVYKVSLILKYMVLHVRHFKLRHVFFNKGGIDRLVSSWRPYVFCGGPNQDLQQQARLRLLGRQSRKVMVMGIDADDDDAGMVDGCATALILEDFRGLPSGYST